MRAIKMLRNGLILAACILRMSYCVLGIPMARAEEAEPLLVNTEIEASADVSVYSKYIWRGFKLDDDPVLQSGAYLNGYGFDASIWGSYPIDSTDALDSDEVDYSVGYTYDLKKLTEIPASISGGYAYYDFPSASANSQEFYLGVSFDVLLSPSFTWYHDFEDEDQGGGDGDYLLAELSYSYPVPEWPVSLDLGGHVGYNNELFIVGKGGDVGLDAGLTVTLAENCTVSPGVSYSIPYGDLEDADDGNQDNEFYGGGTLAFTF